MQFVDIWRTFSKSEHKKKFVYRILLTNEFRIDQSLLIWQFLYYVDFFGSQSIRISRNFNFIIRL